jgi:hypothetical protein
MDAPTLGPAGVLPPVGWMTGAHLQDTDIDGLRYIVLGTIGTDADADPLMAATVGAFGCQMARVKRWRTALLLDGPLDFATRALLALVAPDVEQPLTAPGWESDGEGTWWLVVGVSTASQEWCMGSLADCPRRALALALYAAAGVAP